MIKCLERGWHELSGIKFYGSHPLPDMLHDLLKEPEKFKQRSYCQICMRERHRCVCQDEKAGDVKNKLNSIRTVSILCPINEVTDIPTHLGYFKEKKKYS